MSTVVAPAAGVCPAEPDINLFVLENGRLPRIGDAIAPWDYRGWLLWHCQLAHGHPDVVDRWAYYARTLEAGRLLDEPIPQINFTTVGDGAAFKMLQKAIDLIFAEIGSWQAFAALVDWIAWGMAVSREKPRFSEALNDRLYRHFDLSPLLTKPHDYLGALYADGKGRWNPHAFFPTPHSLVECMVRMTMGVEEDPHEQQVVDGGETPLKRDPRTATVCDPCVGSGRMLLHASNYTFCLYGVDIDALCCRITAINGALYAPWLTFPFSEKTLGVAVPAAPPAPLPIPVEYQRNEQEYFRVDDLGQGLLFGSE